MSEVEAMSTVYETAIHRLQTESDTEQVIPDSEMDSLRSEESEWRTAWTPKNVRNIIPYKRATTIVRTILSVLSTRRISEVSSDQRAVIQTISRFVSGPLLEMEYALRDDTTGDADWVLMRQLRTQTQRVQHAIVDVSLIPPSEEALPDVDAGGVVTDKGRGVC